MSHLQEYNKGTLKYTLALDVYGTLIDTSGVFTALEKLIGENAVDFMKTWRSKQLEYSFRRGLMQKFVDFSICTKDALDFCCIEFKTNLASVDRDRLMDEYRTLPAFPDVEDGLRRLKGLEYKIYAFSNGSYTAVRGLLEHAGLLKYFDEVVSVETVKMFKPSPLVYSHFNQSTGSEKAQTWLVSSNPFDVAGAISYGMSGVFVQRTEDIIFDPGMGHPTLTIRNLSHLAVALAK